MEREIERLRPHETIPRHRHGRGYIAVVLSGSYVERGDRGRFRAMEGQVVFHDFFEAHSNQVERAGAEILNLELPTDAKPDFVLGRMVDLSELLSLAREEPRAAAQWLLKTAVPCPLPVTDWPDLLAADLQQASIKLSLWASAHRLNALKLCRGFQAAFGVSPSVYRLQAAARRALREIVSARQSLAEIAHETGFADQAHMTRAVVALTGRSPGVWRKSIQETDPTLA